MTLCSAADSWHAVFIVSSQMHISVKSNFQNNSFESHYDFEQNALAL